MKGGYQIIDLRKLNLELSSETGSITDVEILDQLRSLRVYIEKGHNYTKPLNKALKGVIVRYRDGKNGEKLEACQWANIECSNDSLTYEIKTKNLMIEVVFEEKTDEYDNKYYDIKTAKYLFNHNGIIEGDLIVGGDVSIGGDISVDETSKVKIFENIVDKDGHARFIEGDITMETISGFTQKYGKWTLSGSHLMIVLAVDIAVGTFSTSTIAYINIPQWVKDKIIPIFSVVVDRKTFNGYDGEFREKSVLLNLRKGTDDLYLYISGDTITDDTKSFRFEFDLLIDNE